MSVTLSVTYHDPQGGLGWQIGQFGQQLRDLFVEVLVLASPEASSEGLDLWEASGATILQRQGDENGRVSLGKVRRQAVAEALKTPAEFVLFCDGDRVLHWVSRYPEELTAVIGQLQAYDFTVLGRTPRAFRSHSEAQVATEGIVNHVFATVSGLHWDVTAAARGFSRQGAQAIVGSSQDDTIGNDTSWPLLFQQQFPHLKMGYIETEGLEFETPDRFAGPEWEKMRWLDALDKSPVEWAERLRLAQVEVLAMKPFMVED